LTKETETALRLSGVSHTFDGGVHALGPLDVVVARGARVGFLGPSGCGKSTALRIVARLIDPSAGEVAFPSPPPPGGLGYVFQDPVLPPWARVRDIVALPLRLIGRPVDAARVDEALRLVGLEAFGEAYPRELSGGMRMRVSLARAVITRPAYMLLDEPFAALDEITRWDLNEELLRLTEMYAATTVFVTHSVYEAAFLCDRILVFSSRPGRIAYDMSIPEPYPRDAAFRMSSDYVEYCREASEALAAAMGRQA